jgi:hypothetical protein
MKICEPCGDWNGNAYEQCVACGGRSFVPYRPGVAFWQRWHGGSRSVATSRTRLPVERVSPRG